MVRTIYPILQYCSVFIACASVLGLNSDVCADEPRQDREQRLSQCQSCHASLWEGWKKGPHGNAATALIEFREAVLKSPELHGPIKLEQAKGADDQSCHRCHAPQNLFESFFSEDETVRSSKHWTELPNPRTKDTHTGVDCISCHAYEERVMGRETAKDSMTGARCKPKPSSQLSNQEFCYVCHAGPASEWLKARIFMPRDVRSQFGGEKGCYGCHADTVHGEGLSGTLPWPERRIERYRELMTKIKASLSTEQDKNYLQIETPRLAAHAIPSQSVHEILFLVSGSNEPVIIGRLNIKKAEDERFAREFPGQPPPGGIAGSAIDGTAGNPVLKFELPSHINPANITALTIQYKSQYWLPDRTAKEIAHVSLR